MKPKGYFESVEVWIKKEFSKVAHNNKLWSGTWSSDVKEWQAAAQQYLSIRSVTQPDQEDLYPGREVQLALVKRLRRMLFSKADYFKISKGLPQFMNFLLDLDEEFDKCRCESQARRSSVAPTR